MRKTTPVVHKSPLVLLSPGTKFGLSSWIDAYDGGNPPLISGPGGGPWPDTAKPVFCFTWSIKKLQAGGTKRVKKIAFQITNSSGQQLSAFAAIVKGEEPTRHEVEEFRTKAFPLRESSFPQYLGLHEGSVAVAQPCFTAGNRVILVVSPGGNGVNPKPRAALTTIMRRTAANRRKG